jgi:hypothetical protein
VRVRWGYARASPTGWTSSENLVLEGLQLILDDVAPAAGPLWISYTSMLGKGLIPRLTRQVESWNIALSRVAFEWIDIGQRCWLDPSTSARLPQHKWKLAAAMCPGETVPACGRPVSGIQSHHQADAACRRLQVIDGICSAPLGTS